MVIQRILRHANVSTTATYYIKTEDVRKAMTTLENSIAEANTIQKDTIGTPSGNSDVEPSTVQKRLSDWDCKELAEREGFKPSVQELARTTA
jgi:hypothetical protein